MPASLGASGELRQHAVAEAMHVVDRALQALRRAIAEQPHIDRADAEVLKPPDVPDPVGVAVSEQFGLALDAPAWSHAWAGENPKGQHDLLRIAAALLAEPAEALEPLPEGRGRVHRVLWVRAHGIPAVGIADGATERGRTFPAHPDRNRLLHRFGREDHIVEAHIFAVEFRRFGGPEFLARGHPFVGHVAAIVERGGADRLELFAAPADTDAQRQAALGEVVDGG